MINEDIYNILRAIFSDIQELKETLANIETQLKSK